MDSFILNTILFAYESPIHFCIFCDTLALITRFDSSRYIFCTHRVYLAVFIHATSYSPFLLYHVLFLTAKVPVFFPSDRHIHHDFLMSSALSLRSHRQFRAFSSSLFRAHAPSSLLHDSATSFAFATTLLSLPHSHRYHVARARVCPRRLNPPSFFYFAVRIIRPDASRPSLYAPRSLFSPSRRIHLFSLLS